MARAKGKKAHKARVAKRNKRIAQQKYAYDKAVKNYMTEIQKQMQERAEAESDNTKTGTITSVADGIVDAANASVVDGIEGTGGPGSLGEGHPRGLDTVVEDENETTNETKED